MLLGKADLTLQNYLPTYIYKPTFGCVRCMASVHGSIAYCLFNEPHGFSSVFPYGIDFTIIPFVVCVSGLNVILSYFLD